MRPSPERSGAAARRRLPRICHTTADEPAQPSLTLSDVTPELPKQPETRESS